MRSALDSASTGAGAGDAEQLRDFLTFVARVLPGDGTTRRPGPPRPSTPLADWSVTDSFALFELLVTLEEIAGVRDPETSLPELATLGDAHAHLLLLLTGPSDRGSGDGENEGSGAHGR
jgi:acyl carrier protein